MMQQQEVFHFIGIGGIGMSGLAKILLARNKQVSGSDISASYVTDDLEKHGASIHIGHDEKYVHPNSTVIFNSDIPHDNPELQAAKKYECKLLHRSDLLKELMRSHQVLAVTGTHGKTTTSALLSHTLRSAGWDPAFAIGGMCGGLHAHDGTGDYFVIEADESDGTFLKYDWTAAIITNIDSDHLAHYGSMEKLEEAFRSFAAKGRSEKALFYCYDDSRVRAQNFPGISYGFHEGADLRILSYSQRGFELTFDILFEGKCYRELELNLAGQHNVLNAAAVFGLAISLGVPEEAIRRSFKSFPGVKRRMDKKADIKSILIYDDYAHHPEEIEKTLHALRAAVLEKRIIAIFQPHRFSRMKHVMHEFDSAFHDADVVVVTDIFTASEKPVAGVTVEAILENIKKNFRGEVVYIERKKLSLELFCRLRPHDVLITLGAGDITKVGGELATLLEKKELKKYTVGVLFGGMNCEHEVSCRSAKNVVKGLLPALYNVKPFLIKLDGTMLRCNEAFEPKEADQGGTKIGSEVLKEITSCDLIIPVLHGPFGEDGIVQGFLETLRIPYVGCDSRASALAMDKALSKYVAKVHDVPIAPFIAFDFHEFQTSPREILSRIREELPFPVFVKPSHLGSSVGVSKVDTFEELEGAIDRAFQYDTHLIVEKGVIGAREIELAVLGNYEIDMPHPGEVLTGGQVYSYEAKYGPSCCSVTLTPELSGQQIQEVQFLAEKIYRAIGCQGLARVDFFLDERGHFYFNEINPFPGFTAVSLYPKMWEKERSLEWLLDRLVILALHRSRLQEKVFCYSSQNLARE
jgi:UDP-N-acetylmuramate--alanine ligase